MSKAYMRSSIQLRRIRNGMYPPMHPDFDRACDWLAMDLRERMLRRRVLVALGKHARARKAEPVLRMRLRAWTARTYEPGGRACVLAGDRFRGS